MQIHNFYSDMVPTVRSPLDSIVLSPHTIKHDAFNLNAVDADSCDYQTVLPSISSCKYYDQDSCRKSNTVPKKIWRLLDPGQSYDATGVYSKIAELRQWRVHQPRQESTEILLPWETPPFGLLADELARLIDVIIRNS